MQLTTGGFESQESYAARLSLGFTTPWADFSGGVALNWNFDLSRYTWVDVNGDGILDQIHKIDNSKPARALRHRHRHARTRRVRRRRRVGRGDRAGQQASLDRTNGVGGEFDFTVGIGPLCLVACYLIINPGSSYQNSVSTTPRSTCRTSTATATPTPCRRANDDTLTVRHNLQGTPTCSRRVHNPLGGTITMKYERDGNTVDHPDSVWTMESVSIDDGRPGDGVDVQKVEYDYAGLKYDRVHRDSLGYATITETEIDTAPNPVAPLRDHHHQYLNDNVFTAGLEKSVVDQDGCRTSCYTRRRPRGSSVTCAMFPPGSTCSPR